MKKNSDEAIGCMMILGICFIVAGLWTWFGPTAALLTAGGVLFVFSVLAAISS